MRTRLFAHCFLLLACQSLAAEEIPQKMDNVLLVTIDGLRWQELFDGAEETLMNKEFGGVRGEAALRERFWRESPEERREELMPFFWKTIAAQGVVYGNPETGSLARVTNPHLFSYPGYSEILTGFVDPRIDSNAKTPNPNVTVLEWLHRREGYDGRVRAFASWDVFPFIINTQRSEIPVNAGWQRLSSTEASTGPLVELDRLADELPHYWDNVRYDLFTFRGAEESLRRDKPRVMYVAFGETDDWAHAGRYDLYLDAARRTDDYIRRLWTTMQSLPQYAGKTSLVITTDHGRGDSRVGWKSHGDDLPEADRIWIAVLSPNVAHAVPSDSTVTQSQVAATVAALLGEDYHQAVPKSGAPLPFGLDTPSQD